MTIDGNGKDNVDAVVDFVRKLQEGYDYVQGSRYRTDAKAENRPLDRTIGNRFIHAPLMSIAGRRWFTDTTDGYRGNSRRYLLNPRVAPFRDISVNYELLFYLTAQAGQLGFSVYEIPVRRSCPVGKATPTKVTGISAKTAVLTQLLGVVLGKYSP